MLIKYDYLLKKYGIAPKGVIQIGASTGQEAALYVKYGINKMIFIEALPHIFEKLKLNIKEYPGAIAINACIGDENGKDVWFNVASNDGQSSSMLDFDLHSRMHPSVKFVDKIKMRTRRMDSILDEMAPSVSDCDLLNIDLQGAELLALKGMGDYMKQIRYAYMEVNKRHLYKDCPLINEIDDFLAQHELTRVETKWSRAYWGDAFYIKKSEVPPDKSKLLENVLSWFRNTRAS